MKKPLLKLSLGALLVASGNVWAMDDSIYPTTDIGGFRPDTNAPFSPNALKFDNGLNLTPTMGIGVGHDSNVNLSNGTTGGRVVSSDYLAFMPTLKLVNQGDTQRYDAYYTGTYTQYRGNSSYNYNDTSVGFDALNEWSSRLKTSLKFDYTEGHDPVGAYIQSNTPERWIAPSLRGVVHYGAKDAQGQGELEVDYVQHHYITDPGLMNQFDYNTSVETGRFYYRLAPKTHWVVQMANTTYTYTDPISAGRTSTEQRYTTGVKWDATAKTSGTLMVGYMTIQPDTGNVAGDHGFAWDAKVDWKPLTYSTVTLRGLRDFAPSYDFNSDYIVTQGADLTWTHNWTERIQSRLNGFDYTDMFRGYYRVDERRGASLNVNYAIRRWLRIGLEEEQQLRQSNVNLWSFTENITMVTLEGGF